MIKQFFHAILLTIVCTCYASADTVMPSIMILPSDNWCTMRYYTKTFNNQGTTNRQSDYRRAFQEDSELNNVISKVGELLTDRGYSLKDAEQAIKAIDRRLAEDEATYSAESGAELSVSPLDLLKMQIKSDIVIRLNWIVQSDVLTFTIEAFDSYTNKRIATSTESKKRSSKPIALQIQDLVKSHIKPFDADMKKHFADINSNGREIAINIRVWDNSPINLETTFNGDELLSHIQQWTSSNTVNHKYVIADATENMAIIEQVRIPMERNGMSLDARSFLVGLQKHLSKTPFNVTSKIIMNGLGSATLIIGEK